MAEFTGQATLIFPESLTVSAKLPGVIPGWSMRIKDSLTGQEINTVTKFDLHCDAESLIWAEFTMFIDQEGNPVYGGIPPMWQEDDDFAPTPHLGKFSFLITGVTVEPLVKSDTKGVNGDQLELPFDEG